MADIHLNDYLMLWPVVDSLCLNVFFIAELRDLFLMNITALVFPLY